MKLKALSLADLEEIRQWRNEQNQILRTPFLLTQEQQSQFYHEVICNRQANARYWGIWIKPPIDDRCDVPGMENIRRDNGFIGMCGLENIQWENRLAEISLLLKPIMPGEFEKYGAEALKLLFKQGFLKMNLDHIFTEVYGCSPHFDFWLKMAEEYNCITAILPNRKFYDGSYWDSLYINFDGEDFWEHENTLLEPAQTLN